MERLIRVICLSGEDLFFFPLHGVWFAKEGLRVWIICLHCAIALALWLWLFWEKAVWGPSRWMCGIVAWEAQFGGWKRGLAVGRCVMLAIFWVIWMEGNKRNFLGFEGWGAGPLVAESLLLGIIMGISFFRGWGSPFLKSIVWLEWCCSLFLLYCYIGCSIFIVVCGSVNGISRFLDI